MKCWVCEDEFFFSERDAIAKARESQVGGYHKIFNLHRLIFEQKETTIEQRSDAVWSALRKLEAEAIDLNLLLEEAAAGAQGVCGDCYNASHRAAVGDKPFDERMAELREPKHREAIGRDSRNTKKEKRAFLESLKR